MQFLNDTIVALATPPGEGAIGIIRLSGKDAISITESIFKGRRLSEQPSHTIHFGRIVDRQHEDEKIIDEVVVSLFRGPHSYTGEDVTEISCHGSPWILHQVISLCTRHGAIIAKPGEFTQRAFLNGRLDLTQAEAVADLIASQSGAAHQAAMHQLRGGFSQDLKHIREELISFSALIELELDFSQEDVEFADRRQFYALLDRAEKNVVQLAASFNLGNAIRNGIRVAIIGKPNAGKSTLLNALLNEERAIVSEIAGTTRDTIEETLNINGIVFRLIDTAGIRDNSTDIIENIGIERSRKAMSQADVVVYLFDVNTESADDVLDALTKIKEDGLRFLAAGNKSDELGFDAAAAKFTTLPTQFTIFISAREKTHVQDLKQALYDMVIGGEVRQEGTVVTNARHFAALQEVLKSLQDIRSGMDNNLSSDLLSLDIRRCLHFLGEITGEITTEDKLDYIFSKFCIGK